MTDVNVCRGNVGTPERPRVCRQKKLISNVTGIGLCPVCDVVQGQPALNGQKLNWPESYTQWYVGQPYPGARKESSE